MTALKILSLDGGGYLGLATASFIAETERHNGVRFSDAFELFCGTSTGSIIAICLAIGKSGPEIVELYETLGTQIFKHPRWGHKLFRAKYANASLKGVLEKTLGDRTVGDVFDRGKKLVIPAFSVTKGRPRVFKTDHAHNLTTDNKLKLVDVAMASSAAPSVFPTYSFAPGSSGPELFCDGGVAANHPALVAYAEALSYLERDPKDVRILSVSTPRQDLSDKRATVARDWGQLQWGLNGIASVLMDSNSYLADTILACISRGPEAQSPVYIRVALENKENYEMDQVTGETTRVLKIIGSDCANNNETRDRVKLVLNGVKNG